MADALKFSGEDLFSRLKNQLDGFFYNLRKMNISINRDEDLAEGQIFLLFSLLKKGPLKISDIAAKIGISSAAVTGMTDKLEKMGLVTRERSGEDRRVVWINLTETGRQAIERIHQKRCDYIRSRLTNLSEEELIKTIEAFELLNTHLSPGTE